MKLLIAFLIFFTTTGSLFSQAYNNEYNIGKRIIDIQEKKEAYGLTEDEFKNLKGSPYINEEFVTGNLYNGQEVVAKNIYLRYNAYSDEIEIKRSKHSSDNDYGALLREPEVFVKISDKLYVLIPYEKSNEEGHYFEILSEGKAFDLYKKTDVEYSPPKEAKTSYDRNKPAEFKQFHSYYLVGKNGSFYELPNSKTKIIKLMSKEEKSVKDYVNKNKLDLNKENDLIKLVTYLNSVIQ